MQVDPYLCFQGRTEEAMKFYERALGLKMDMMMRNKESPEPPPPDKVPPGAGDKILHASLPIGKNWLMAGDGPCSGTPKFEGICVSLTVADAAEADRVFNALVEGGSVQMPLGATFFSPRFGMLTDRFGLPWIVIVPGQAPQ
jgi:PhnB protein